MAHSVLDNTQELGSQELFITIHMSFSIKIAWVQVQRWRRVGQGGRVCTGKVFKLVLQWRGSTGRSNSLVCRCYRDQNPDQNSINIVFCKEVHR